MKVRTKFILAFLPLLAVLVIFCFLGMRTFFSIHQLVTNMKQNIAQETMAMIELKKVLLSLESGIIERNLDRKKTEEQIRKIQILLMTGLAHSGHRNNQPEFNSNNLQNQAVMVIRNARYLLHIAQNGWSDPEVIASAFHDIHKEQRNLSSLLDEHIVLHVNNLINAEESISRKYRQGIFFSLSTLLLMFLIIFFMVVYLSKTVLTPISLLHKGINQLGNGCFDYDVTITSGDEFEDLAKDFKKMATKLNDSYKNLDEKILSRTKELTEANAELQKAESQIHGLTKEILRVQENERKMISLDLHDNVAQELSALKVMSETLFSDPSPDINQLRKNTSMWSNVLKRCIGSVRELSYNLRPSGLEQMGLTKALAGFCREYTKKTNIPVEFSSIGMEQASPAVDYDFTINVYRLAQEALQNIYKHANATIVKIRLLASGRMILLQIEDNGRGFDVNQTSKKVVNEKRFGLLGMQERMRMLRGTIDITSEPGKGTKIFIEIPWENQHVS